jgi:hypothetical protein
MIKKIKRMSYKYIVAISLIVIIGCVFIGCTLLFHFNLKYGNEKGEKIKIFEKNIKTSVKATYSPFKYSDSLIVIDGRVFFDVENKNNFDVVLKKAEIIIKDDFFEEIKQLTFKSGYLMMDSMILRKKEDLDFEILFSAKLNKNKLMETQDKNGALKLSTPLFKDAVLLSYELFYIKTYFE